MKTYANKLVESARSVSIEHHMKVIAIALQRRADLGELGGGESFLEKRYADRCRIVSRLTGTELSYTREIGGLREVPFQRCYRLRLLGVPSMTVVGGADQTLTDEMRERWVRAFFPAETLALVWADFKGSDTLGCRDFLLFCDAYWRPIEVYGRELRQAGWKTGAEVLS